MTRKLCIPHPQDAQAFERLLKVVRHGMKLPSPLNIEIDDQGVWVLDDPNLYYAINSYVEGGNPTLPL
jgi:hypothetical protein